MLSNSSEARLLVYADFGRAFQGAQTFEWELFFALLVFNPEFNHQGSKAEPEIIKWRQDFIEKCEKESTSNLIKSLKKYVSIDSESETLLIDALKIRNYLAHRFFRINTIKMLSFEGCSELSIELQNNYDLFSKASKCLAKVSTPKMAQQGYSVEKWKETALDMLKRQGATDLTQQFDDVFSGDQ